MDLPVTWMSLLPFDMVVLLYGDSPRLRCCHWRAIDELASCKDQAQSLVKAKRVL